MLYKYNIFIISGCTVQYLIPFLWQGDWNPVVLGWESVYDAASRCLTREMCLHTTSTVSAAMAALASPIPSSSDPTPLWHPTFSAECLFSSQFPHSGNYISRWGFSPPDVNSQLLLQKSFSVRWDRHFLFYFMKWSKFMKSQVELKLILKPSTLCS